jgi:hypothetical protein
MDHSLRNIAVDSVTTDTVKLSSIHVLSSIPFFQLFPTLKIIGTVLFIVCFNLASSSVVLFWAFKFEVCVFCTCEGALAYRLQPCVWAETLDKKCDLYIHVCTSIGLRMLEGNHICVHEACSEDYCDAV